MERLLWVLNIAWVRIMKHQKKERLDYSSEASKTGFMWRKYFDENPINDLNSYSAVTPVIRYAEVLLSYLECLIESGRHWSNSIEFDH